MQDNIRIPTSGVMPNDASGKLKAPKPGGSPVENIDPARVTERNSTDNSDQNSGLQFLLNQKSVFQRFISQLQQTPGLSQTLKQVMAGASKGGNVFQSDARLDVLIRQLNAQTQMEPGDILENLRYQDINATKFSGEMFRMFRQLLMREQGRESGEFEAVLGRFLKDYANYFSVPHSMASIVNGLNNVADYMTRSFAEELQKITRQIEGLQMSVESQIEAAAKPDSFTNVSFSREEPALEAGQSTLKLQDFDAEPQSAPADAVDMEKPVRESLRLLKESVLPLLSKYIGKTHDYGRIRTEITQLVDDISRLNITSRDSLLDSMDKLLNYCYYSLHMPLAEVNRMRSILLEQVGNGGAGMTDKNTFASALTRLVQEGSRADRPESERTVFQGIARSLLLDNSVYMPLIHLFLPVTVMDRFLFTELWIGKDAPYEGGTGASEAERTSKIFLTFDISGLGYFEAVLLLSGKKVTADFRCPDSLKKRLPEIQSRISGILHHNGLSAESVSVAGLSKPRNVAEVFPNLYERAGGINVTV